MYGFKPPIPLVTCTIRVLMTYDRLSISPTLLGPMLKIVINSYTYEGGEERGGDHYTWGQVLAAVLQEPFHL